MRDKSLEWLFANDPEARGPSRRRYTRDAGILTRYDWEHIRAREDVLSDPSDAWHCEACRRSRIAPTEPGDRE